MDLAQIAQLLDQTLSPDGNVVRASTDALDGLSLLPQFPFALLSIAAGGQSQGQRVAASTYLKNFARRNIEVGDGSSSKVSKEFKAQLLRTLLQAEASVLKVLVEAFRIVVIAEFVKQNSWPELVPELRSAIQSSNVISNGANIEWSTINTLTVLHALVRPFQYFLNPKVAKEPVPPQLELIAKEILAPLLTVLHHFVEKATATHSKKDLETEKILLLICKCLYFAVRSYMPSAVAPLLSSFCHDLIRILGSLSLDHGDTSEDEYLLRLKIGKRALQIFCSLTTRHRKYCDKLMPNIINCVLKIVKFSSNFSKLDFLSERIVSLAFDVISHILETGPGWRLVSPHFSFLLDSSIIPALVLNEKDILEWEEDPEEYIRKNLPSELEEISGWREDLFTTRKNSTASDPIILKDYFGVLMAYGGLQDFLREQKPAYTTTLVQTRVLPLYSLPFCPPYLVAAASWVLGELASCLPEEMSADIYYSLFKALAMPDNEETSCYPVRVAAAGAIAGLLENEYLPPEWLPLLQVRLETITQQFIPHIISSLVDVMSKSIHPSLEPWPHVVERGFEALAVMAQSWENFIDEEDEQNDSSEKKHLVRLPLVELYQLSCNRLGSRLHWLEVVSLHSKYGLENFIVRKTPPAPAPPVPQRSIIEAISAFVSEAILQYPCLLPGSIFSFQRCKKQAFFVVEASLACYCIMLFMSSRSSGGSTGKEGDGGFVTWASALAFACTRSSEVSLSAKSEIKLAVMTLVKMIERLLGVGNPRGDLLQDCFASLIETSIQLKELDEEMEEEENGEESEDDNNDEEDDEIEIDDEESESELEETEEQFLERYAQAASALEDGIVEEGDAEDQELEIELGNLEEVDEEKMVVSLIGGYHQVLIKGQALSSQLVSSFISAFPDSSSFFHRYV
ncbi:methyltransferase-like protein 21D-like [Hibiscus syriacus]|uniref:Methyltransferase-like protein 21D-like n=1 Tax=Hibiscus syriacus TaxID=106335 RepID=A0A6A3C8S8_HIBSY|nr:methyltransferase-like protein 21D-like [Hibiscus syriacus]